MDSKFLSPASASYCQYLIIPLVVCKQLKYFFTFSILPSSFLSHLFWLHSIPAQ